MKRSPWAIQRTVVFALMLRELKTRFDSRLVGLVWVLFEPMAQMSIILFIRIVLRERFTGVLIDAPVFLLVAMVPYFAFRNIWFRAMQAVGSNGGLFAYRHVKPWDAMVGRALMEAVLYVFVYAAFMLGFGLMGYQWAPHHPLEYMVCCGIFVVLGFAFGMISAVTTHAAPAAQTFLRLTSFPLYLLSGVLLPISTLPPQLHPYLLWNPLLHIVELSRGAFFTSYHPLGGANYEYPIAWMVCALALGMMLYRQRRIRLLARA